MTVQQGKTTASRRVLKYQLVLEVLFTIVAYRSFWWQGGNVSGYSGMVWPNRRPLVGKLRGSPSKAKCELLMEQNLKRSTAGQHQDYSLHFLQLNANFITPNLNEFCSILAETHPEVVCMQEDGIVTEDVPFKVDNYTWIHEARSQPRSSLGKIKGGGVSILLRNDLKNL